MTGGYRTMMLQAVLANVEVVERKLARVHLLLGRPVRVHAFSGYGHGQWASVGGRVLVQAQPRPAPSSGSWWAVARANLLPFMSVEVPHALVRVTLGNQHLDVRADADGYVQALVQGVQLPPGRHAATLTPLEPGGSPAHTRVHVPHPAADVAIVSDVDDTIVDSGIAHGLAATLRTTLLREQSTRVPLAGAPELYRALAGGAAGGVERPFFYLSTSPWNLANFLEGFLTRHGFPAGPLVLTDWGPGADGLLRIRTRTHKLSALRRLAEALPDVRFVLIGDSGQEDPAIYAEFSREHTGRVAAIYIRRAGKGPVAERRYEQAELLLVDAGVPYVIAGDTAAMYEHAQTIGLLRAG